MTGTCPTPCTYNGDFELLGGTCLIMESPDTTRWCITIDDTGTLITTAL
jgi:hypothetical protein